MKKFFKEVFKTIFFRGNYQFLPTVIYFWFCVLMFFVYFFNGAGKELSKFFLTIDAGMAAYIIFAGMAAYIWFNFILFVFIANLIGILIYQWIRRAQTHKLRK